MTANELCKHLVGLNYDLADYAMWALGHYYRILYNDKHKFVHTRDYKPDRINIGIKNNIVVEAKVG